MQVAEMDEKKTVPSQEKLFEKNLKEWINQEKSAIELIGIIGQLWFDKSVELVIFRKQLIGTNSSSIIDMHLYARNISSLPVTIHETLMLAKEISKLDLGASRIDIGRLAVQWLQEKNNYNSALDFISNKLKDFVGHEKLILKPKDVVLYGFGRIGRLAARMIVAQASKGEQLRLRAIVTRGSSPKDIVKRADLLRTDSVHGAFPGTIIEDIENQAIIVNGHIVKMIAAKNPEEVDYESYGIHDALLIDNTGVYRSREELEKHLMAKGISQVLLTAPGKGDIPNIVYGVNHKKFDAKSEKIFSAASCTTNAIIPVLSVINRSLGIERGHIETIHAYTNDQNLLDNYHSKHRRGRSAALNMVITETGADSAITKVIPELAGKLTANAVRVPTPNGSLAILSLSVGKHTSKEEVNAIMRDAALNGSLIEQIRYSYSNELVSSDVVGIPRASIFDSPSTIVSKDGKNIVLYVWYDNEYGYTNQVVKITKYLAGVVRLRYY
jgi:glyceraldehyde 3-phosphate dehydrogenase